MKGRMGLVLSLAAGVLAVVAVALYLNAREASLLEQAAMQDVVVATQDILQNTVVDERVVEIQQVPRKYLQPGAVGAVSEAVGRVAAVPIARGAQLTGMALTEGGGRSLAFEVPRGMRAVTVAINDVSGVAGLIRPGNFVDIVGIFEYGVPSGSAGGQITYSQEKTEVITIAQNVQVIAMGRDYSGQPPPLRRASEAEDAQADAEPERAPAVENLTLLVNPPQVQEVVLAQQIGSLAVSLRSNLDAGQVIDLNRLDELGLLKVTVPVPLKRRPEPSWREIRGTER